MTETSGSHARTSHPAKFPRYVLARLELYIRAEARALRRPARVLDPFAGVGRIHDLPRRIAETTGVEIEPEWAACRARTVEGDATALPADWTASFDVVATSPCYGNRIADHHEARDSCAGCGGTGVALSEEGCSEAPWCCSTCGRVDCVCGVLAKEMARHNRRCLVCRGQVCGSCGGNGVSKRYTYRHALGRMPAERSSAALQWGGHYRTLHRAAWAEAHRVLRPPDPTSEDPGGLALINIKNHVRQGAVQQVAEWHKRCLGEVGFRVLDDVELEAPGLRHGENRDARVEFERIIVARRSP